MRTEKKTISKMIDDAANVFCREKEPPHLPIKGKGMIVILSETTADNKNITVSTTLFGDNNVNYQTLSELLQWNQQNK